MNPASPTRSDLVVLLNTISEYHPDLEPFHQDSKEDLLEKYFYWVDEYNDGYDPHHIQRPGTEEKDYKQWIADLYHCSDCWGQKMTTEEMELDLIESRREADPDDYVPDPSMASECAAYWNELCDLYPN